MLSPLDEMLIDDIEHEFMAELCMERDETLDYMMEDLSPIEETRELFPIEDEMIEVIQ